jgi:hypothetical protein
VLYTNQELVQNFLGRELTERESNILSTIVVAIERQIDNLLGTTFQNTATLYAATRYYDGGTSHVDIDPVQNITSIQMVSPDGSITDTLDSTNYVLQPKGQPVTRSIAIRYGRIPKGYSNLKIIGDFTEYGAEEAGVPSDIKLIATRIAGSIIANPDTAFGLKSESVEGHQVVFGGDYGDPFKADPVVVKLLQARSDITVDDSLRPGDYDSDEEYFNY